RLTPTHAEFDAFMEITLPQHGQQLVFMARGIKFSDGGGIVGDARLELVSDYAINFDNNKMQLVLKGTANSPTGTYVSMDCDGFKELGLEAELLFSRDMLLPEHYNGNIAEGRVTSSFSTIITDWNDLIVDVSLPSFQVPQLKGVGFTVQNAVFDYSDLRNAPSVVFPESYESADFLGDSLNLWRGFYLRELSIRLPEQFKTKDSQGRIEFAAYDMLIDKHGFSGLLEARNILDLGKGDMNGWSFSVNSFSAEVQTNQLVGAGFGGQIVVPISNSSTPFTYSAFINPGDNYIFSVSPEKQMDFPLWKAGEVEIYEASYLQVQVVDKKFYPSANLHGKMSITAGDSKLSIADIRFEDLYIRSEKPFVSVGAFSVGSEAAKQGLGNFPLSVNNIGFATPGEGELALKFDVVVNLVGENDGAFGGTAGLMIVGKLDEGGEYQSWKYNRVDLTKIGVNFNTGPVIVAASLEWYKQDPTYGDGFRGEAMLEVIDKIKVEAVALFGANADTRYWFVDALATLPPGAGSGIELRSIGGGAYYHMAQTSGSASPLGASLSGIVYKPDASVGLGLRATVDMVTAGSDKVFNGDATLEIAFNAGGGLKFIDLKGNGYFVTPALQINQEALKARVGGFVAGAANKAINMAQPKAQISANVHINYDNLNRTLHGNFEVFVNVAMGVMRGVGANNRAGWAVM
ncbi:MAG: hypothetical protein KY428_12665, partial [Bacteroidetes bacterium]|nr:hypothetical protein [Bacteroidota bacterium]